MTDTAKRNLVAQWAFDTRPVLLRFHLWLEDVEVERSQAEPVSAHTFAPRGIARCLAMTSAATALGTRLFGQYGAGAGRDKTTYNQVKKAADAVSAYVMSEGLWHLTRTLPENHALMVCLGEGLMPKAGETPEMGANPMLGFGRVYARPEVARTVDRRVRRLLNEPGHTFEQFYEWLHHRGITLWGAAADTLENTSRFAEGKPTGPMAVFHLFDSPLRLSRPYESYMGCMTVPARVAEAAEGASLLLDYRTPRKQVAEAIEAAYPGIRREHVHVWTLRGTTRVGRLGRLWEEWEKLGVHLVDDGWKAPSGLPVFTDSGTYAPTFLDGSWRDAGHATRKASSRITFTLRLMEPLETTRQVFSPLLVRFLSGVDHMTRPVKISDSGRIRNELQTMLPQALEHHGERILVHFERINEMVMLREKQAAIRKVLEWYKANHPVWFEWLEVV